MPSPAGLHPPLAYWTLWLILAAVAFGLSLFVLAVAGVERPRRRPRAKRAKAAAAVTPDVRRKYLALIDQVAADVRAGLSSRDAHQRLAGLVRGFVGEASGRPVQDATLAELGERGLPEVAAVIARLYPAEFERDAYADPAAAIAQAREVVAQWR